MEDITFDFLTSNKYLYRDIDKNTNMVLREDVVGPALQSEINISKARVINQAFENVNFSDSLCSVSNRVSVPSGTTNPGNTSTDTGDNIKKLVTRIYETICRKQVSRPIYEKLATCFSKQFVKVDEMCDKNYPFDPFFFMYLVLVYHTFKEKNSTQFEYMLFHNDTNPMLAATLDAVRNKIENDGLEARVEEVYEVIKPTIMNLVPVDNHIPCSNSDYYPLSYFPSEFVEEQHTPKTRWTQVFKGLFTKHRKLT